MMTLAFDGDSTGTAAALRTLADLERRFSTMSHPHREKGRVVLLVRRGEGGQRETLDHAEMTPESGMPGDAWGRQRRPSSDAQLTVMQANVAELIANGEPFVLFGDNVFLDLDLSADNVPPGTRIRAGSLTLEVTPMPHTGCRKFRERFGDAALRFVSKPQLRELNLRGVYMRVVESGRVAVGDAVEVISRPTSTAPTRE